MSTRRRILLLVFLGAALAGLVLLAMGLSQVSLQPGRPFYLGGPAETPVPEASPEGPDYWAILRILVPLLLWVGLPLLAASIIWAIVRKKREYLILVLIVVAWTALIFYLEAQVVQNPNQLWQVAPPASEQEANATPTPTDVFDPRTPDWLTYAVSAGLAVLLLGAAWGIFQAWRRRPRPLELVAQEAQATLDEISAGADWKNAIVKCYAEMCQALHRARGLARKKALTPREFALELEQAGLPGEHIQRLTRLFEMFRYGSKQVQPADEHEAVACLQAIVEYCRGEP